MTNKIALSIFLLIALCSLNSITIGYALSGGGARGFAHIGMLKVMEEVGIKPDYISGTSIGALIGGLYAMGYSAAEMESLFIKWDWRSSFNDDWIREELYIGQKRWAPYGNAYFRLDEKWRPQLPQSVIVGNKVNLDLFQLFAPSSSVNDFADLPIPFTSVATDLLTGELAAFSSGSLMQGIRASMSIPSILQPFPLNNTLYIDGGISQNLPGIQVKEMGADFVIGFKANTALREEADLRGLIHVLDQTINIGITHRLNEQLSICDMILEPDLTDFSTTSFNNIDRIIQTGEMYARQNLDLLLDLADSLNITEQRKSVRPLKQQKHYKIDRIAVYGNENIASSKIREYLGLHSNAVYTIDDIVSAVNRAWNSQLFEMIYPVLKKDNVDYVLNIYIKERERKYLAMNFSYDSDNALIAGAVLSLHNYFLKNSHVLTEVKLGGKYELNIDMVKNFGEDYGIYYRLFPYLDEKRIYFYNDDHNRINSARSLEYGLVSGIGLFARKAIVIEGYTYSYATRLYREISEVDFSGKTRSISGLGLKAYHESLDDFVFPVRGMQAFGKLAYARDNLLSEENVSKLKLDYKIYRPFAKQMSMFLGVQMGSHFMKSDQNSLDPFYLGGLDCFAGIQLYEKSAPHYRLVQAGLVANPLDSFFVTAKIQSLNYSDDSVLFNKDDLYTGAVLELGLKTYLGPVKLAAAITEGRSVQFYFSLGYVSDIFHFSRR